MAGKANCAIVLAQLNVPFLIFTVAQILSLRFHNSCLYDSTTLVSRFCNSGFYNPCLRGSTTLVFTFHIITCRTFTLNIIHVFFYNLYHFLT